MAAIVLMVLSASVVLLLGSVHLIYTLRGNKLWPRDAALRSSMEAVSPVISAETTMWRAWLGFNISHSFGAMLFGLVFGYLALAHSALLFGSTFLLWVGLLMLSGLSVLAKLYWFRIPLIGLSTALLCYLASIAVYWFA